MPQHCHVSPLLLLKIMSFQPSEDTMISFVQFAPETTESSCKHSFKNAKISRSDVSAFLIQCWAALVTVRRYGLKRSLLSKLEDKQ